MQEKGHKIIYPAFDSIRLQDYELINGYYTLGFLKHHRPDCVFITEDQWQDYNSYEWLDRAIKTGLQENKIVCVVPWDEHIINPEHLELSKTLNKYQNDPVWLITQLDEDSQKIYTFQHNIKCKIVELPWWFLNDCLCYYAVADKKATNSTGNRNFLCMLGRYEQHKFELAKALKKHNLAQRGLITVPNNGSYPKESFAFCEINPCVPYKNKTKSWPKTAGQVLINDILVSNNVENFLWIEKEYADIPLMINPETTCGIFFSTEKSLWPLLLGKLMLVYGRPGVMNYMQRFYDIDFGRYADLIFDQPNNDYTENGNRARLELLIDRNQDLISDCKEIYNQLKLDLEQARWTIGQNIYKYFVHQLEQIKI